jgi:hypothetical protein
VSRKVNGRRAWFWIMGRRFAQLVLDDTALRVSVYIPCCPDKSLRLCESLSPQKATVCIED